MELTSISVVINGVAHDLTVNPTRMLSDVLRNELALTGTKEGCRIGVCGACTVIMNGKMISSCLTLTGMAHGAEITTIEGLGHDDELDVVQKAFLEKGGLQCGICTPGHIVAARALLDEVTSPTVEQVKEWMTGNLCRCTGYYKIVDSIMAASVATEGGVPNGDDQPSEDHLQHSGASK